MFDRDIHPNVPAALDLAARSGVEVVMSNPCIELWFILHYEDQLADIERHPAQRRSAELLGCTKNLTVAATDSLYERYDDARCCAMELDTCCGCANSWAPTCSMLLSSPPASTPTAVTTASQSSQPAFSAPDRSTVGVTPRGLVDCMDRRGGEAPRCRAPGPGRRTRAHR